MTIGVMNGDRQSPTKAGEFTIHADAYVLACGAGTSWQFFRTPGYLSQARKIVRQAGK